MPAGAKKMRLRCSVRASRSGGIRNSGSSPRNNASSPLRQTNSGSSGEQPPAVTKTGQRFISRAAGEIRTSAKLISLVRTRHSKCSSQPPRLPIWSAVCQTV